jgi:hypothetical protein
VVRFQLVVVSGVRTLIFMLVIVSDIWVPAYSSEGSTF